MELGFQERWGNTRWVNGGIMGSLGLLWEFFCTFHFRNNKLWPPFTYIHVDKTHFVNSAIMHYSVFCFRQTYDKICCFPVNSALYHSLNMVRYDFQCSIL